MKGLTIATLIILIVLLLCFGAFAGYHCATGGVSTSFADTALFTVALVGVLVALAALGIWATLRRILQEDIEREIAKREETSRNEALARMASKIADAFWSFYEEKQNNVFREEAINMVDDARNILEGREIVDKEELKCRVYNNLAYAYAEKGETSQTTLAHFLSNYAVEHTQNFPKYEIDWLETYAYVLYRLPKKRDDKKKAIEIIKDLLERPDIPDIKRKMMEKSYGLSDTKEGQASNPDDK